MRRFISIIVFLTVTLLCQATEYGDNHTVFASRFFLATGQTDVKNAPSKKAATVFTAYAGDVFFVETPDVVVADDGSKWVRVSGGQYFVPFEVLTKEDNPEYIAPKEAEAIVFETPAWLLTLLAVTFVLYSALFVILGRKKLFRNFLGKVGSNGMRKILFYNKEPYLCCLKVALYIAAAFVATFLTFIIIGSVVLGVSWLTKIIVYALIWILIVGGGIGGIILAGMVFDGSKSGAARLGFLFLGAALVLLAVFAVDWREMFYAFGDKAVSWGQKVFNAFSIFKIGTTIIGLYWKYAVLFALIPILALMVCALGFITFNGILANSELIKMKRYGAKHKCPHCGKPSEPAIYYSHEYPLPDGIELRPGKWGIYHIEHPVTHEQMPTRFKDGKDMLRRECPHCHEMIDASIGAEKHIAFAGLSGSGKSALMYRLLGRIKDMKIGIEAIARDTDQTGFDDKQFISFYDSIRDGKAMSSFPNQTRRGRHKSLQLIVSNPKRGLPYRLYFNDLAGEMFTAAGNRAQDAPFFRNTQILLFMLDPFTMKVSDLDLSDRMVQWYESKGININETLGKISITEAVDRLMNMLKEEYGRNTKDIHLIVNLAKSDEGYLKGISTSSSSLKSFVENDLGLKNQVVRWDQHFKSVEYVAVSAKESAAESGIDALVPDIFDKLDMSFKGVTEEALKEDRIEYEKLKAERDAEFNRSSKSGKSRVSTPAILAAVISVAIVLILSISYFSVDISKKSKNYKETIKTVERVFDGTNYDDAARVIDKALKSKKLSGRQIKRLQNRRDNYLETRKNKIDELLSTLAVNFSENNGQESNLELSAKYKAVDNFREVKNMLDELLSIDPENEDGKMYQKKFDALVRKYKIRL